MKTGFISHRNPPCSPASAGTSEYRLKARLWAGLGLLLVLLVGGSGCQTSFPQPSASADTGSVTNEPFTSTELRQGDTLQISFEGATNLNTVLRVPIDGKITMPFIGQVDVLGKTPPEVKDILTKLYEPHLRTAEITVQVPLRAAVVYVTGAVLKPGAVPLTRSLTVLDAVMEAGGPDPVRAKLTEVAVLREEEGRHVRHVFNLKRVLKGEDSAPFYLKPYDKIYVPEKTFNF